MSNTIQNRWYSPQQATLHQVRPSMLIDTAAARPSYIADVRTVIGSRTLLGTVRRLLPFDLDVATSAVQAVENADVAAQQWAAWEKATKNALRKQSTNATSEQNTAARLRVQRLSSIQAILGLSMQDFAAVLALSRAGLYKWLDGSKDVRLQDANRERLDAVERIAERWRARSSATLNSVANEPLAGGHTALEFMTAPYIDEAAVVGAFNQLQAKLQAKPKTRSQKLAQAGYTRRPSAKALSADE